MEYVISGATNSWPLHLFAAIAIYADTTGIEPYCLFGDISSANDIIQDQYFPKFSFLACPAMTTSPTVLSHLRNVPIIISWSGHHRSKRQQLHNAKCRIRQWLLQYSRGGSLHPFQSCLRLQPHPKDRQLKTQFLLIPELLMQQKLTKYFERMESTCHQLAKHLGEPLHFQWTIVSGLWYKESLEDMVCLLDYFCDKVEQDGEDRMKCWLVYIWVCKTWTRLKMS